MDIDHVAATLTAGLLARGADHINRGMFMQRAAEAAELFDLVRTAIHERFAPPAGWEEQSATDSASSGSLRP